MVFHFFGHSSIQTQYLLDQFQLLFQPITYHCFLSGKKCIKRRKISLYTGIIKILY